MANATPITIVGNAVGDPELRSTATGTAVASVRVASTPRNFNKTTGQWEDGEALFLTVNVWKQEAENLAASITKGMRVIVYGDLVQRSYQTKEGESRTVYEINNAEVATSLKYATAQVTRNPRDGDGNQPQQGNFGNQPQQGNFGNQPQQGGYNPQANGFNNQPAGQYQGGFSG